MKSGLTHQKATRCSGMVANSGKPSPIYQPQQVSEFILANHPEQFPNPVVLVGETISLFFSLLNLVGIFTHHFFALNTFAEPSAGPESGSFHQPEN